MGFLFSKPQLLEDEEEEQTTTYEVNKWLKWKSSWVSLILVEFEKSWVETCAKFQGKKRFALQVAVNLFPDMMLSEASEPGCNIIIGNNSQFFSPPKPYKTECETMNVAITMSPLLFKEFSSGPLFFYHELMADVVAGICAKFYENFPNFDGMGILEKRVGT